MLGGSLPGLNYDVCVLTGDYRGATFGPFDAALAGMARLRPHLKAPIYGVLGNHDTIRMVPGSKTWESECCSTNANRFLGAIKFCIWPASTMRIIIASTISKRPPPIFPTPASPFFCRTRPKFIVRRHMPGLICFWRDTRTGARLSARLRPNHAGLGSAAPYGLGALEISRYVRLHVSRCRLFHRYRADQLPAGDYAASSTAHLNRVRFYVSGIGSSVGDHEGAGGTAHPRAQQRQ